MRGQVERFPIEDGLVYRLLLAVDVVRYSRMDALKQLRTQSDLRGLLDSCAMSAGLDPDLLQRQVRGDGELVVLPAEIDVCRTVGCFAREFERGLALLNGDRPADQRLRIRLAMHHGTMIPGPLGPAGDAPVVLCRLLDSRPLRRFLAVRPQRDLAMVVSDSLYQDVIRTGFCALNPADFDQIRIVTKQIPYCGYIHTNDSGGSLPLATPDREPEPPRPTPQKRKIRSAAFWKLPVADASYEQGPLSAREH